MTDKPREGRPPKYTEEQVARSIEIVEAAGDEPDGNTVKAVLCQEFGVSRGINAQSLGEEVRRQLTARDRRQREALIASLSPAARDAATDLGREIGEQFLVWLGRQAKEIRAEADAILSARDEDCAALRAAIRALRDDLGDKTAHADRLAEENAALEARLDEAAKTIGRLEADLAARHRDEAFKAEVINTLKDMLARNEEDRSVPQ